MDQGLFGEILIMLASSVLVVGLFYRYKIPTLLAYMLIGIIIGPYALGWISNQSIIQLIAEFGLVFLLFTIGLEFSLAKLIAMKSIVFKVGGLQVVVTTLVFMAIAYLLQMPIITAFIIGGALALSSTAIVSSQLSQLGTIRHRQGKLSIGILLFQDLVVIPFLIIIPVLATDSEQSLTYTLLLALLKGIAAVAFMIFVGLKILPKIFNQIAKIQSEELFVLSVLMVALSSAWLFELLHLSMALGAFLGGIMLGETQYRHQIAAEIRPFRDILLGLFFISVGMLLNLQILMNYLPWVLLIVLVMMLLKTLIIFMLCKLINERRFPAMQSAISLCQAGEFAFIMIALARNYSLIDEITATIVLSAGIISMALTPFLMRKNTAICLKIFDPSKEELEREQGRQDIEDASKSLENHVIICGFGRVGQTISRFLDNENIPRIALDYDPIRVQEAQAGGENIYFGDVRKRDILLAAGITKARMVIITIDDYSETLKMIQQAKQCHASADILVRTPDDAHIKDYLDAGATEVIPETLEASLMLISHILVMMGVPIPKVIRHIQKVRSDRYKLLHDFFHGEASDVTEQTDDMKRQLHAVKVDESSAARDKSIIELGLAELSVELNAVHRGTELMVEPEQGMQLIEGDVLVLAGTPEAVAQAEINIHTGINT